MTAATTANVLDEAATNAIKPAGSDTVTSWLQSFRNNLKSLFASVTSLGNDKQDKITSTGNANLLTAPATAGGQPGTKPVTDFATPAAVDAKQDKITATGNTNVLLAPTAVGGQPGTKPLAKIHRVYEGPANIEFNNYVEMQAWINENLNYTDIHYPVYIRIHGDQAIEQTPLYLNSIHGNGDNNNTAVVFILDPDARIRTAVIEDCSMVAFHPDKTDDDGAVAYFGLLQGEYVSWDKRPQFNYSMIYFQNMIQTPWEVFANTQQFLVCGSTLGLQGNSQVANIGCWLGSHIHFEQNANEIQGQVIINSFGNSDVKILNYLPNLQIIRSNYNASLPVIYACSEQNYPLETYKRQLDYSTSEQYTGEKWVNGKKIYRRIIYRNTGTITLNEGEHVFMYNVFGSTSYVDEIIRTECSCNHTGNRLAFNTVYISVSSTHPTWSITFFYVGSADQIVLYKTVEADVSNLTITFYYTKQ